MLCYARGVNGYKGPDLLSAICYLLFCSSVLICSLICSSSPGARLDRAEVVHDATQISRTDTSVGYGLDLYVGQSSMTTDISVTSLNETIRERELTYETVEGFSNYDQVGVTHTYTPTDHWINFFGDSNSSSFRFYRNLGVDPSGYVLDELDGEWELYERREKANGDIEWAWGTGGTSNENTSGLELGSAFSPSINFNLGNMSPFLHSGSFDPFLIGLQGLEVIPLSALPGDPYMGTVSTSDGGHWTIFNSDNFYRHRRYDADGNFVEERTGFHEPFSNP